MEETNKTMLQELNPELIKKIRGIQLRAKGLVNSSFAGEYKSAFRGRGMEFDEIREYVPGDDIRSIDWNVTARTNHPYVKVFKDERELTVLLAVDVSSSCLFGSHQKNKKETMAEICALIAYLALGNNDKVGLLIFTDQIETYIPPKKGRGHIWQIIRTILNFRPHSRHTSLKTSMEFIRKVLKKKSIIFFLSDFLDQNFEIPLRQLARSHQLTTILFKDPLELNMEKWGFVNISDLETGETLNINSNDSYFQSVFQKDNQVRMNNLIRQFQTNNIDHLVIDTHRPYINVLTQFFKQRERKLR